MFKKTFLTIALFVSANSLAIDNPLDVVQIEQMVKSFDVVCDQMHSIETSLRCLVKETGKVSKKRLAKICQDCVQLKYNIAQLGVYKQVPGFTVQCQKLIKVWIELKDCKVMYNDLNSRSNYYFTISFGSAAIFVSSLTMICFPPAMPDGCNIQSYLPCILGLSTLGVLCAGSEVGDVARKLDFREANIRAFERDAINEIQVMIDALQDVQYCCTDQ